MKGVELFVIVLVVATALGAIGYMIAPSGISGLQTFNSPPSQNFGSLLVESTPSALNLDDVFFDSDGETLTYAVDDSAVVLNGNTLAFSAPANFAGDYTITITVSDGTNTIAKPFTFILPASEAQTAPAASPASTQEETRGTLQEQPIELVSTESQISDVGRETSSGKSISAACTDCTDCTTCAATPGNTCTLSANIDSTDTCITVPASGVTIDCAGFNITYASTTDNSFGIDTAGVSNTIITGCNITQTSGTFQASPAINLGTSGGGFQVLNSRIITPGTGISGSGITSLIVQNTNFNLSTGASGFSTVGVDASGTNIIIRNNSFSATGNGIGIESFGSTLVNISNNTFSIAGVTPGNALELNINHSNVTGNRMIATTSNSNFNGQNVTVTDNRFRSLNWVTGTNFTWRNNRASSTGEHVFDPRTGNATSMNDTFTGRLVLRSINFTMHNSTFNSTSIGVLRVAGINITIENATARASGGIHLIGVNGSGHILSNITIQATATPLLNLTNTTNSTFTNLNLSTTSTWISFIGTITDNRFFNINMSTSNGSIFYPEFNVSTTGILNRTNVTITLNQTFVNTTGLSFLNQSAQIQLRNLTFTDPLILIDTNDDGVYATCAEPDCTEISYNGSTIVFNVSHFTSHAISEGANAHPTIAQVILNSSDGSGETSNTSANGENLTVVIVNATDADNDAVQNITDWRVNGTSIAVLNMPFETNSSNLSTGAIRDYSQFGKNGTLGNGILASAPAWNYSDKVGGSYVFDGTDDFINTSFNDPIVNGVWTITAWIKHNQTITSDGGHLFEMSDGSTCLNDCILARVLETNGNFILVARSQAGETVARQTNRSVNDSQWHHIAMVVDVAGDSMQLYVDGLLNQSAQTGTFASTIDANRNLIIGRRENPLAGTDEFTGSIDEFIIFNRSLSAAQIYQLYLDGNNSRHMETLHADETGLADVWSVAVTPNDNQNASDGTTVISNNVTILADNTHPSIQQVILNNSNGAGYNLNISNTSSNLTVFVINATDANNDSVQNITDWRINGASIAVLNLPFETNFSSNTVDAVRDYSTFGNNGTLGNGSASAVPIWNSSGKAGGAYTFDGTDDYIDCGVSGFPSTVPLTLEAWAYFNQDQGATDFDYVIQASGFDNTDVFIIARQATTNNVYYFENNAVRTGPALSTGSWNHVVMVFRATAPYVLFYLNGTNQTITQPVGGALTPTGGILCELGRFSGGSHFLNGSLDEVKIYNYELPAEQVYQNYLDGNLSRHVENIMSVELTAGENWSVAVTPNDQRNASDGITVLSNNVTILADPLFSGTPALNGSQFGNTSPENLTANLTVTSGVKTFTNWYVSDANVNNKSLLLVNMPMDGGTLASGKVRDYSPNDNHATPVGVVYTSTGGYDGRGAYTFDGSDGLTFPTNITFGQQDNWTVAFWAQRTADDARGGIFGKQRGVTTDTIWLLGDIIEFRNNTVGTDVAELQYSFDPNTTRQHYAFVANNHRLELYVNGTFFQAIDAGTGFTFDGMGEFFTSSFDFAGTADDLLVWNASLTPSQIYAIYSGNTTRLHSAMTRVGETLLSQVTPNNNIIDDTTQYSNNITIGTGDIFGRNQTYINSSSSTNTSTENITLNVTYATNVSQVYSYIRNGSPILAAYYTFNTEEEVMRDYSGSNRTGQRRRLVTWQPTSGRDGKGVMNFAGSDDSLTIPPMTWNPRQPWSVSFWAQKSADNDQGAAIGARDSVTDVIWIQSTLLEFRNSTDGGGGNSFAWDANTSRNFYTLVAPGTDRLDLYVNGTYFNSLDVGTGFIINDAGDSVLGFSFGGTLDDIAIWNTTLTPSQIRALFNNRSDVVVNSMTGVSDVWQMRTIPGDNFSDGDTTTLSMTVLDGDSYGFSAATLSGLSSNSTNENLTATFSYASTVDKNVVWYVNSSSTQLLNLPFDTEAFQTRDYAANQSYNRFSHVIWEPTAGVDGRGQLHFQGSNDYISVPQTTLTGTQPWTITVWAQKDLDGSNGGFVGTTNGVTDFISIRSTDVEFRNSTVGGGGPTFAFDANTSRHFYAFRAGGNGSLELFVNGSRIGAVTMGTNFTINNIGAAVTGTAEDFDGTLDEFILWNRSLSQEQIQALYAGNNTLLVSQETQTGDTWQACEVPTDGIDDGQVRCTNAVTIADANNTHPTIAQVILNSTDGSGAAGNNATTNESLTVLVINATDADGDSIQNITDWRLNGASITVLNLPFETNSTNLSLGGIRDYSLAGNNGWLGGGVSANASNWTLGQIGGAYSFDGAVDVLVVPSSSSFAFGSVQDYSWEAWVNLGSYPPASHGGVIIEKHNLSSSVTLQAGVVSNGKVSLGVRDTALVVVGPQSAAPISLGSWHHVVATANRDQNLSLYIDGVLSNSTSMAGVGNVTSGVNISIGNTVYTGGFWQGLNATIDEVRIYNRSLSAEQVAQLYQDGLAGLHMTTLVNNEISADDVWTVAVTPNDNQNASDGTTVLSNAVTILELPPSVILNSSDGSGYAGNNASDNENLTVFVTDFGNVKNITDWMVNSRSIAVLNMPFEGGSNSTFTRDYSTFGNNGQVLGPTWNQTGGFDSFGAYEFDGVNDYVELGNRTSLDGRGPTSISAWVKTTGINGDIVSKFGDADLNDSYVLRVNSAGQAMFSVSSSGFKSANSLSVINNGQYHHVMGVFTGSAIQIYVNGTLENSTAASGTIDASNATVKIGRGGFNVTGFGGEYFNGTIDEVMIFNRSFSTTQVSQYYSDLLTHGTLTTLVSDQTLAGQAWSVNVTTNNGTADTGSNTSNSVTILGSIVSGTKTDSADPVSNGQTFTYQINTTITNSTAYNVTVIESYPSGLSFVSSQPTPTSGNNVFALGDLSNTTFSVNVTVQVTTGVTQGYGNVVNISYNDADGYNYSQIVTQSTAYISIVTCSSCVGCTSCLANPGAYCRATNAITGTLTCINMTADNATFDCNGFELNYGTAGGSTLAGIAAANRNNITIRNCFIRDTAAGGSGSVGINFTNVDNSIIQDNNITTNGTSLNFGIRLETSSTGNTIQRNNITARGTSFSNYAIYLRSGSNMTLVQHNLLTPTGPTSGAIGVKGELNIFNTTVYNNTIRTSGAGVSNYGVAFDTGTTGNNTINNNSISTNGTSATSNNVGVRLVSSYNNTVTNNFIRTNGTSTNYGITITSTPCDNNTLVNNTVATSGTSSDNDGIRVLSSCGNTLIQQNSVTTYGTTTNMGISSFTGHSNSTIRDNIIFASGSTTSNRGIAVVDGVNYTITNNTVSTNGTSSNIGILVLRVNNTVITNNSVQTRGTSGNFALNVDGSGRNNTVAHNVLAANGSTSDNVGIYLLDGSILNITNNTITTNGTSSNHGTFILRMNHTVVSNNSVVASGTANTNFGIAVDTNARNNTLTNNVVRTNGTSDNVGISIVTNSNENNVMNNTVFANGSAGGNFGIRVQTNVQDTLIQNNTITTGGGGDFNVGIRIGSNSSYARVINNSVNAGGTTAFNWGIDYAAGNYSNITGNRVVTNGTSQNHAIHIDFGANHTNTSGNRVISGGSTNNNFGIIVAHYSDNATVEHNTITTFGSSASHGLRVTSFSKDSYWNNNTVTTYGANSYAIVLGANAGGGGAGTPGGAGTSTFNNTRIINASQWISVFDSNTSTLWNTSFELPNGTILIPANFSLGSALNITRTRLNVLNNTAYIDTINVSALNTSATITLNGLNASTPRLIVDYNDDLLAEYCESPQCALSSYNGSTLVFNVSSFTSYSSSGNMSVDKNDTPDPVTAGAQLNYTITIVNEGNDTLINTTAVETYPGDVAFDSSSPTPDVGNNTWFLGNLTNGTVTTINITVNVSSAVANGTVLNNSVNITFANNEGINVSTVDLENTTVIAAAGCPIDVSVSTTLASDITCPATAINILADNVLLDCSGYHITYAVNSSGYGINATSRTNVTIANCNLQAGNVSDSTSAGLAFDTTTNSRAYNITAFANASRSVLLSSATANNLSNMSLVTNGTAVLASGSTGNIFDNMSITPGAFGYSMATGGNNTVIRNIIDARRNGASGALLTDNNEQFLSNIIYANGRGIFFSSATQGLAQNNTVITNSSSAIELSSSTNIIVDNNTLNTTIFNPAFFMQSSSQNNITNNFGRSDSGSFGQQFSTNNLYDNNQGPNFLFIVNSPSNRATNNNVSNIQLGNGNYNNLTNNRVNFVQLSSGSSNNTFDLTTINSTTSWITSDSTSFDNNWTRTNLTNADGAVYFPLQFIMPSAAVANPHMILSTNLTRVNSTNLSFLNATAQILFNSLLFVDPRPVVDLEDDGTFLDCNPPTCAEISYAGGVFVFNVSSFTSYAAQENLTFVINLSADKIDSPDPVARGSQLSYQIVLNNSGNGTARNVTVFESYSSGVVFVSGQPTPSGNDTFSVGDIAPGGTFIVNITVNVSSALVNGTVLNNTVNVTFANSSGENSSFNESELTTVLGAPVLVSIKSDTPDPVVRGSTLNYSILINNTGDDTAFNVTLSETYPAGVSFVTAQPTPTGNNTFAIGTLAPNETFVVNITVTVGSNVANGTLLNNSVNASWRNISGQQGTVSDSETTTVLGIAALTVVKTDTPDPVNNGSVLSYTITVTNTGDETAYNVTAVDGYDVNITFNGSSPTPFSGNDTFALGDLLPGMSTTINITVNVSANMTSGVLNNTVNVTFTNASGVNETTSAFQATTVTTPAVPAAPSGGGGGGGSNFFRNANVTREQPVQAVPVALPTVAPQIQRPEQLEQPRPTVAQNTTVQEPVHTTSIEPTAATTQVDTLKQQNNINKMASFALGALIFIAVFMLLLLLAHRNAKPATVAQSGRIVLKTDLPKTQAQPKPAAKPTTKSARIAKAQKTPPKPAAVKPSEPKKSTPPAHDLKKLSADIEKINTMLRTFDKKLKK